jgi:PDZ domain-containing secreted protein
MLLSLQNPAQNMSFDSRAEVTAEQSKELWDLYVAANREKIGAPIITIIGKTVTPVTDAYEFMKKMNPGQTVTFAKGSKDKEDKRFNGAQAWSDKKGFGLTVKSN